MKIIVTGALGHIGSRFIREIPETFPGSDVVMVDNLSTQRYTSLFNLPSGARYRFLESDVRTADLEPIIAGSDVVVHLAAITDATSSFERAREVEQVNLHATIRVAEACAQANVPMIFPSTTSVYGTQTDVVDEDCPEEDLRPQSPYAESKLVAEKALRDLGGSAGLRFVIFRFGTIFGTSPGMRFHTVVNKFIWQACLGIPLTVWRTALDQKRPYLDLEDGVRALTFAIDRRLFDNRIYNVVTINATVREITEAIRCFIPTLEIELVDSRIMNQLSYQVLSDRFHGLGFEVRGDLKRGVEDTILLLENINRAVG